MRLVGILKFIWNHPLNENTRLSAMMRFFRWQVGSRLLDHQVIFSWINEARLILGRRMTAATGNFYVGLMAFEEMGFLLHYLRPGDVFFDIGANVGTFTILASKAVGSRCVAVEPDMINFAALMDNININKVSDRVKAINAAVGSEKRSMRFSVGMGAISHVLAESEMSMRCCDISVMPLDEIATDTHPDVLKVDTEGYEHEVILGGRGVLSHPDLNVVIMELLGHGKRYGFDETNIDKKMRSLGFFACEYNPISHTLIKKNELSDNLGEMLYIRDIEKAKKRVGNAAKFLVNGRFV